MLFGNDTLSVCKACDLKISEIVIFLNQDREHMQQGIFPDVQQSFLLHSALNFDEVSCKALVGAPLKANEFLKVEQTHLADIIAEEAGNEHLRMQEGAPVSPHPKQTDEVRVVIPNKGSIAAGKFGGLSLTCTMPNPFHHTHENKVYFVVLMSACCNVTKVFVAVGLTQN